MKNNYLIAALIAVTITSLQMCNPEVRRPFDAIAPVRETVAPAYEPLAARTASRAVENISTSNIGRIATEAAAASKATQTKPTGITLEKSGVSINLESKPTSAPESKSTPVAESNPITASDLIKNIKNEQKNTVKSKEQRANEMLINSKATAIEAINNVLKNTSTIKLYASDKVTLSKAIDTAQKTGDWSGFNEHLEMLLNFTGSKTNKEAIHEAIITAETANVGTRLQNSLKLTLAHAKVSFNELLQPFKRALEAPRIKKAFEEAKLYDSATAPNDSSGFHDISLQPNKSGLPEERASNLNDFLDQTNQEFLDTLAQRSKAQEKIDARKREKIQKEYEEGERALQESWKKQDAEAVAAKAAKFAEAAKAAKFAEAAKAAKFAEAAKVNKDQREFLGTDSKPKKEFPLEDLSKQSIAKTPRAPIIETSGFLLSEAAPTKPQESTARPKIEIPTDSSSPKIVTTEASAVTSQNPLQGNTITTFAAQKGLEKLPENPTKAQLEKFSANVMDAVKIMEIPQQKKLFDALSAETSTSAHATDAYSALTSRPKTAIPSTSDSSSGFVLTEAPAARTKVVAQKESLVLPQENTNAPKPTMSANPTEGMTVNNYPDKLDIKKLSQTPETAAIKQFGRDFMAAFEILSPAQKEIAAKSFLYTNSPEGVQEKILFINKLPINLSILTAAEQGGFNNIVKRMGDLFAPVKVTNKNYEAIVETLKTIVKGIDSALKPSEPGFEFDTIDESK